MEFEDKKQKITDEIMEYKELLDEGIITGEEFSIKEKELLIILIHLKYTKLCSK